jgi:alpha-mannosidase
MASYKTPASPLKSPDPNNHQPLIVAAADRARAGDQTFFSIRGNNIYVEALKPADDGKGVIAQIVNCGDIDSQVMIVPQSAGSVEIWASNLMEEKKAALETGFTFRQGGLLR